MHPSLDDLPVAPGSLLGKLRSYGRELIMLPKALGNDYAEQFPSHYVPLHETRTTVAGKL